MAPVFGMELVSFRGVRGIRSGHSRGVILSGVTAPFLRPLFGRAATESKNLSSMIQEECVA